MIDARALSTDTPPVPPQKNENERTSELTSGEREKSKAGNNKSIDFEFLSLAKDR